MSAASALPDVAIRSSSTSRRRCCSIPSTPSTTCSCSPGGPSASPETIVLEITERESIADQQRLRFVLAELSRARLPVRARRHRRRALDARAARGGGPRVRQGRQEHHPGLRSSAVPRAVIEATVAYARSSGSTRHRRGHRGRGDRGPSHRARRHRRSGILARPPARDRCSITKRAARRRPDG